MYFILQLKCPGFHRHDRERKPTRERNAERERKATKASVREAAKYYHPCLKMVEIAGYCSTCDFELFLQIIESTITLEKIIIDTHDPDRYNDNDSDNESEKFYRELQSGEKRRLRTLVSLGAKLVIL